MTVTTTRIITRKAGVITLPLFPESDFTIDRFFEHARARSAALGEKWNLEIGRKFVRLTWKGRRRALRIWVPVRPTDGQPDGRIRLYILDRKSGRRLRVHKRRVNTGGNSWRQNLAEAIRQAQPQIY